MGGMIVVLFQAGDPWWMRRLVVVALLSAVAFRAASAEQALVLKQYLIEQVKGGAKPVLPVATRPGQATPATILAADEAGVKVNIQGAELTLTWELVGGESGLYEMVGPLASDAPAPLHVSYLEWGIQLGRGKDGAFRKLLDKLWEKDAAARRIEAALGAAVGRPSASSSVTSTPARTAGTGDDAAGTDTSHTSPVPQRERAAREAYRNIGQGKQPEPQKYHGLLELATRQGWRDWRATRRGNSFLSERTVFRDTSTGLLVWRMTSDPSTDEHGYFTEVAWNANGSLLKIGSSGRTGKSSTWIMNADGSNLRPLAPGTAESPSEVRGYWSFNHPDRLYTGRNGVGAINPFTGDQQTIVNVRARLGWMRRPHPSDKWFLFGTWEEAQVVGLDGSVQVVKPGGRFQWLDFTNGPDARLFFEFQVPTWEQVTMLPNGSERKTVTGAGPKDRGGHAGFTLDGSWMTFMGPGAGGYARIRPDGSDRKTFLRVPEMGGCHGLACWDGEWFAGDTAGGEHPGSILYARLDGTDSYTVCRHASSFHYGSADLWRPDRHSTHPHPHASPDGTKTIFNSDMLAHYADVYVCVNRLPDAPQGAVARLEGGSVVLTWNTPRRCRETAGYCVYQSGNPGGGFQRLTDKLVTGTQWRGPAGRQGPLASYYVVTAVEYSGLESPASNAALATASASPTASSTEPGPMLFPDVTPPGVPRGLRAQAVSANALALSWNSVKDTDLDHYNVYCGRKPSFSCDQATLVGSPSEDEFVDWGLRLGSTCWYRVTAVDRHGNESNAGEALCAATPPFEPARIELAAGKARLENMQLAADKGSGGEVLVPSGANASATWSLDVPRAGSYAIWVRSMIEKDNESSFAIANDGKINTNVRMQGRPGTWVWYAAGDRPTGTPQVFELSAGSHTLVVRPRNASSKVAAVVVTDDPSWYPIVGMSRYGQGSE